MMERINYFNPKFAKVGMIVRLRSHGPLMTVIATPNLSIGALNHTVRCGWFSDETNNDYKTDYFVWESLEVQQEL